MERMKFASEIAPLPLLLQAPLRAGTGSEGLLLRRGPVHGHIAGGRRIRREQRETAMRFVFCRSHMMHAHARACILAFDGALNVGLTTTAASLFAPPPLFEFSEPSVSAEAQVGLTD